MCYNMSKYLSIKFTSKATKILTSVKIVAVKKFCQLPRKTKCFTTNYFYMKVSNSETTVLGKHRSNQIRS